MDDEIGHAEDDGDGPDTCPDSPPDGDRAEIDISLGVGSDTEIGPHDGFECLRNVSEVG